MPRLFFLTRTALLLAITVSIQALRLPQPITGPLVNMMLILTVLSAGVPGQLWSAARAATSQRNRAVGRCRNLPKLLR